jgi:WD40 repeat protein/serine/threonine protein kinase
MPVESITNLVDTIRQHRLLTAMQMEELTQNLQGAFPDPRALARELLKRNWLSPYQINHLFQGRVRELVQGPYLLVERLAEGKLGMIYKARHLRMNRVVTLQVFREKLLAEQEAIDHFYQEIQTVSRLSHPNIVTAFDAGPVGRTHFLAVEFVEGLDLQQLVKQSGPLPPVLACDFICQTARGLQHALERGLRHHDLKPSNLLVTRWTSRREPAPSDRSEDSQPTFQSDGGSLIKIRNLGLTLFHPAAAQAESARRASDSGPLSDSLDCPAPEEAAGDPADIRSDLYHLGGIFFFLLTGHMPYREGDAAERARHDLEPEPWSAEALGPEVPAEMRAIIQRLLARNPGERYQTPGELTAALAGVLGIPPEPSALGTVNDAAEQTVVSRTRSVAMQPTRPSITDTLPPLVAEPLPAPPTLPQQRLARSTVQNHYWRWINLIGGAVLAGTVALVVFLVMRSNPSAPTGAPPSAERSASPELERLRMRVADRSGDREALRQELLAYQRSHAGTSWAIAAAGLVRDLPSPLDALNPKGITRDQQVIGQPGSVVAVLGDQRQRHWSQVLCIAYHPKGKLLASGGQDGLIYLWDPETMTERAVLRGHLNRVVTLAFSPDGKTVASGGPDRTVRLWDISSPVHRERAVVRAFQGDVNSLAFTPDGRTLITGSGDRLVRLWDVSTMPPKVRHTLKDHTEPVLAVAVTADGHTLATGGQDQTIRLWNLTARSPRLRAALADHTDAVRCLAFSPDGQTLASGSNDRTIRVWDLSSPEPQLRDELRPNAGQVYSLAFSPDGNHLVSTHQLGDTVGLWTIHPMIALKPVPVTGHQGVVAGACFSPDGKALATCSHDTTVRLWDVSTETPQPLGVVTGPVGPVQALAFAPDGRELASSCLNDRDILVRLWDFGSDQARPREPLRGNPCSPRALAYSRDGQLLASANGDWTVRLWHRGDAEFQERAVLRGHRAPVQSAAFARDGNSLATGSDDKTLRIWDLDLLRLKERSILTEHKGKVNAVAYSPNGHLLASASADRTVRFWDAATGSERGATSPSLQEIFAVAFAPDGKTLAAGSVNTLQLWDVSSRKLEHELSLQKGWVHSVAFAPDGTLVASVDNLGHLVCWDPRSRKKVAEWHFPGTVQHLVFSPDSRYLATGNGNGSVYILRLANPPR